MFRLIVLAVLSFTLLPSMPAEAQQPSALATCLADNTSGKDRKDLAKWVFFAIAAHPEIKPYTGGDTTTGAEATSRIMANLVSRLLTESCVSEARAAVKTGNAQQALQVAFEWLGKLAMQELMTDRSVQESMGAFGRYVDTNLLGQTLTAK